MTDLDPRAAVKGSRDPLGIQSIWTRFGRQVIGNLTNASNSVCDFTILILGCYFSEQVANNAGPGTELATFLKWEQLADYSRASINADWGFRGTERVRKFLDDPVITLSAETAHQILSSQKAYGIWGLYSVPGQASGLLEGQPARLRLLTREFVERTYLTALTKAGPGEGDRITELLGKSRAKMDTGQTADRRIMEAVAGLLRRQGGTLERQFYRDHLLYGGPGDQTNGRQRQLSELLEPLLKGGIPSWTPAIVRGLAKEAERRGDAWHSLAFHLGRIETAERVLAPASDLFTYLLGCDKVTVAEVARRIRSRDGWGRAVTTIDKSAVVELKSQFGNRDDQAGQRWLEIADSMANGDYEKLVSLLLQQNRAMMLYRGGAAWIEEENGTLKVRVTEERGQLPRRDDLEGLWRFPYFLNSLCNVALALNDKGSR